METNTNTTTTTRQTHKRTFSESDSTSRTERYLCSFTHLWIINYLSSYIDDPNSTYLQSETFSPVNTPYSNTRWTLKLYPRGLNEKQTPTNNNNNNNNNIAIFLKYVCGTIPTIKAKAEFSVVSRNNELVLLRSTNFHTFSSGNDWGYSEFLDGNYLNSRRNDLLTDDRLRVYVRVILVDEKEPSSHELFSSQTIHSSKSQQASSSSISTINSHLKTPSLSRLLSTDKDRLKSFELLSKQIHSLFDDQRFTDMNIHIIPKQDEQKKSHRQRRTSIKQQNLCQCTNHSHEQISDQHEQIFKDFDLSTSRRTTRSLTSRLARTSSSSSSDLCSTSIPKFCSCQSSLEQEHLNDLVDYSQVIPLATFHVHKSILIARSSLFAHQIRLKLSQSKSLPSSLNLYIDDLQPLTVRTMLIYIYTGQLPNITDEIYQHLNLIDLFRASVKYNLHELRHLTKTTMLDNLKIDNAIEMLEISDQANDQDFKQHILSFIRSNALAITKTTHWIDCTKQNPQLIIDAFRSLVTPTLTKYSNHYHHSISLTTTKQSKND